MVPAPTITFLLVSLLGACVALGLGFAAGVWFFGAKLALNVEAEASHLAARREEAAKRLAEQAELAAARIADMAQSVASDVGDHSAKMRAISSDLAGADCGASGGDQVVFSAVSQILLATAHLQERLDKAEQQIAAQVREIEIHRAEARTDSLTGLANRRMFDDEVKRRLGEWQRFGRPFGIVLLDIDSFKRINDTYGHHAGDDVLRCIAKVLKAVTRDMDIACRYGGEEFAVIVPATDGAGTCAVAKRIRHAVVESETSWGEIGIRVTCSVGVSHVKHNDNLGHLVRRADEALYAAKQAGSGLSYWHNGLQFVPLDEDEDRGSAGSGTQVETVTPPPFLEILEENIVESSQRGIPLAVMQLELEDLDLVRHKYGRAIARQVTSAADVALQKALREPDILARLADDTFLVLLPGKTPAEAERTAKRMRKSTRNCVLPLSDEQLHLRWHYAIASLDAHETAEELLARVQQGLKPAAPKL